ncbi:MAG TPA: hypothetical protein PJ986_04555 [Gammaproteobacteria bacterium]|nr:hypothetical protein [Gammaproteobacteria bacterium]
MANRKAFTRAPADIGLRDTTEAICRKLKAIADLTLLAGDSPDSPMLGTLTQLGNILHGLADEGLTALAGEV